MAKKHLRVGGYAVLPKLKTWIFYILLPLNLVIFLTWAVLLFIIQKTTLGFYNFNVDIDTNF